MTYTLYIKTAFLPYPTESNSFCKNGWRKLKAIKRTVTNALYLTSGVATSVVPMKTRWEIEMLRAL
jgi:hypothetical protein